ncbi:MAG: Wzy polymerase domain-containing protein [Rhodoferax sp.]|uniref:PglL family O-oligosaccharyltransferase n=1 Tax=Rhodoferax sp. TaxID=50421 RepID=UPI0026115166|nr:Wzy polymerase domain-containing protein [Rhodoferax sp.]MDD2882250.1 Wzy polymerase domain-containing protein [Rhodoferax sp.]
MKGASQNGVRAVAWGWLLAAVASAAIGLLQYFGATDWADLWVNHTRLGEAYGNLRQRNQFATLMNIGLAALLWGTATLYATASRPLLSVKFQSSTALLLSAAILLGAANAASSSRTGLFQLALLSALTWAWQRQTNRTQHQHTRLRPVYVVLFAALLAYGAATVALPLLAGLDPFANGAWARLRSGDALCSSRLTLWSNVLHLIALKPWLGWGWGELDYAHFITLYPGARFCDILDNAHNLPLHLAVELGLPIALSTCGVILWLVWRARPWRELDATRQLAWAVLAVIAMHSLLEYPLWYGPFQMAALLSVWLLWHAPESLQTAHNSKPFAYPALYIKALPTLFVIAFCAYAAWNYQLVSQIYLAPTARMADYRDDTMKKLGTVALFQDQVRFANLTTIELDAQNAREVHALALDMLHFSPESRVVEQVLESGKLLGNTAEVRFFTARYKAAFPAAYTKWAAAQATQ